jgi:LETM1 and EF-hand domain-containing protein 1, mitochondrial
MRSSIFGRFSHQGLLLQNSLKRTAPDHAAAAAITRSAHVYVRSAAASAASSAAPTTYRPTGQQYWVGSVPAPTPLALSTMYMHTRVWASDETDVKPRPLTALPSASQYSYHQHPFRMHVRPRMSAGVTKHRSIRRSVSSSSSSSPSSSQAPATPAAQQKNVNDGRLVFRDALRSPRKAVAFTLQSGSDLAAWGRHMWAGVKLLAADTRVSLRVVRKISQGKEITRRERNFVVQTGVDLARLVPFSLFLIIPAAEFALPFALRLFPNMLPSQFQSKMQKEENMKRQLKANLELAKFLRDVVEEKVKVIRASDKDSTIKKEAGQLADFLEAIRSGQAVDVSEVSRFARLFNDELTLDGAVRPQLVAMCKYMGISAHGTDQLLRFRLRSRLNSIKKDDMVITWEGGSNSLTDDEVVKACRDRGIRMVGVSNYQLRQQLSDWLEMSQDKAVPASLMIMSRAFLYTGEDALKETLSSLSDDVYDDVKVAAESGEGSNIDRLEEARRQTKLIEIESEREERKHKEAAEKKKRLEEEAAVAQATAAAATAAAMPSIVSSISDAAATAAAVSQEAKIIRERFDSQSYIDAASTNPRTEQATKAEADRTEIVKEGVTTSTEAPPSGKIDGLADVPIKSEEDLAKNREAIIRVVKAIAALSSESAVDAERMELENLKDELAEAESVLQSLGGGNESELRRFKKMVKKLERQIETVDAKVSASMKLLDLDNDGVLSMAECTEAIKLLADSEDDAAVATETLRRLDADADGNISREDLHRLVRELHDESGGLIDDIEDVQEKLHVEKKTE